MFKVDNFIFFCTCVTSEQELSRISEFVSSFSFLRFPFSTFVFSKDLPEETTLTYLQKFVGYYKTVKADEFQ